MQNCLQHVRDEAILSQKSFWFQHCELSTNEGKHCIRCVQGRGSKEEQQQVLISQRMLNVIVILRRCP